MKYFIGLFLMGYFIFLMAYNTDGCMQSERLKIVDVGGCDRQGYCGVLYEDGRVGTAIIPVKGEVIYRCVKRSFYWLPKSWTH